MSTNLKQTKPPRGTSVRSNRLLGATCYANNDGDCDWRQCPRNPKWKGGQTKSGGRVLLRAIGHPYANSWGYVYRYRLVMEKKLGRYLRPDEIVHHKDGNFTNDRLSNLELCDSSLHSTIHNETRTRNKKGQFTS